MTTSAPATPAGLPIRRLARITFTTFLLTFIASRLLVILIMTRHIPGLLVFTARPSDRMRQLCALFYGFGMALTFDEFGMWLHLGGSYWQRASFDAVIVLLSLFGVIAFAPSLARMRTHHWAPAAVSAIAVVIFYLMLFKSIKYVGKRVGPRLLDIEETGPR